MVTKRGFLQDILGCIGSLDMLDIADELVSYGSVLEFVGPEPALGVSRQDIQRRIRRWLTGIGYGSELLGDTKRQA